MHKSTYDLTLLPSKKMSLYQLFFKKASLVKWRKLFSTSLPLIKIQADNGNDLQKDINITRKT